MKIAIFYLVFIVLLIAKCNHPEASETDEIDTIVESITDTIKTTVIEEESTLQHFENKPDEEIISIGGLFKNNKVALALLDAIGKAVANTTEIKTLADIEKVLQLRDSMVDILNNDKDFENRMLSIEAIWNYFESFEKIGISMVSAEGIYICLDRAPLLPDLIEKYADAPFKIKSKIENLFGSLQGGEYPFENISKELALIPLAEELLTRYPGYKYNKDIAPMLDRALLPLVDFHTVGEEAQMYVVGNFRTDNYPGITDISYHKRFIKESKSSRFAGVISNILRSPSNIGSGGDTLYYISVPALKSESVFADEKLNEQLKNLPDEIKDMDDCFKYMWLGIDIPHILVFSSNEKYTRAVAYRFYDRKEPALESLMIIRKIIPGARLIEHPFSEDEKKYELGR